MVTGDVAADDAIAQSRAAEDVADGALEAARFRFPSVLVVTDPGDGRGVERREAFGMTPRAIQRADERDEFGILFEAVAVFAAIRGWPCAWIARPCFRWRCLPC